MTDIPTVEQAHSSGAVPRRGVTIVRASGSQLFDATGRRWIDCSAAHGWAALGHTHPAVTEAIRAQAGRIVMLTESASNDMRARWFSALVEFLGREFPDTDRGPLSRIAAANSGAEGIEAALKFARIRTGRTGVVAFTRGFHGRTFGALTATAPSPRRDKFAPLVPGFAHATYNDLASAESKIGDDTAAVIVEVVQGEGGVHEGTTEFLKGIERLARDRGALLIIDEIQTGFGRTGRWFASAWHGLNPDIIVLGKALGGGLPLGAAVWRRELGGFEPGLHGSTFAGAPLVAAASVAAMEAMTAENLAERAARLGDQTIARLRAIESAQVRAVRGRGLMIGIELKGKVAPVIERLMERGVWALPAGLNVLRLLPPLNIPESDLDAALDAISETLRGD
ncbi:MAG TPA: aminotransferase class III-fold pyridoxal phosphate-dependent enzyme [Gemmatimonadales bacterium]|nr:aminotransferase class III-fold pyridoxal phosphate-dependent enzyme [Gemmatimonadales bacterium]